MTEPETAAEVKRTCVGYSNAHLADLRRHDNHAVDQLKQRKKRSDDKKAFRTSQSYSHHVTICSAQQHGRKSGGTEFLRPI